MQLTHQDIQNILRLLDETPYDELNLQTDQFTLALKRGGDGQWQQQQQTIGLQRQPETVSDDPAASAREEPEAGEAGLLDIRAPMAGTFYRSPKPGAAPFIEIGSRVDENSVVCIIEVMKLMSSIPAAINGEVREILVEDARPVDRGQLLMRVRPAA